MIMEQKKDIYEIVDNYFYNEDSHFYCIDAYKWGEEEGHVVAVVHNSGDVWFCHPEARISEKVRNAIKEVQEKIAKEKSDRICDRYSVWVETGISIFGTKDEINALFKGDTNLFYRKLENPDDYIFNDTEYHIPDNDYDAWERGEYFKG